MQIEIPAIPAGVLTLVSFFSPYAIALINHPSWEPKYKRIVAILVSLALAAVVLVLYFLMTGDVVPQWWNLLLLAVLVSQSVYALLLKPSASGVEARHGIR